MASLDELILLNSIGELENLENSNLIEKSKRLDAFLLSDRQFINMFRLTKFLTEQVIQLVENFIAAPSRTSALDVKTKVLITLRFLATGSYQLDIASNIFTQVSQPSASRVIHEVINALNHPDIFQKWVQFPGSMEELCILRDRFYNMYGFPGVIGCIDCTHVAIIAPKLSDVSHPEHVYVNRKNYHSINTQIVCDWRLKIISINARNPGSTHDAYIWRNSKICEFMENLHRRGEKSFYLLGDSGYPLRPWLLTPLEDDPPIGTPEAKYNTCHKSTRSIVERCNGVLKMRFRCLLKHRVLNYSPNVSSKIINACAVLHNMCIEYNVPDPDTDVEHEFDFGMMSNQQNDTNIQLQGRRNPYLVEARSLQKQLIRNYFT